MDPRQRERPFEFIRLLDRDGVTPRRRQNGYSLFVGDRRIGFVRYNIRGDDAGRFAVYATEPFDDPYELFENRHTDGSRFGPIAFVDPDDTETIGRVVAVLRSAARAA